MAFPLPDFPYDYDALEPHIDEQTMRIHHDRHHQGYTDSLNRAVAGTKWEDRPIETTLRSIDQLPEDIRTTVRRNGGGFANHRLFWQVMSPDGGGAPRGELAGAIQSTFGSVGALEEKLTSVAAGQFGSGWGWLIVGQDGALDVYSSPNQDSPYMHGHTPILGVDVWEHSYYLRYQNERGAYLDAWWNVVNWNQVSENFQRARSGDAVAAR